MPRKTSRSLALLSSTSHRLMCPPFRSIVQQRRRLLLLSGPFVSELLTYEKMDSSAVFLQLVPETHSWYLMGINPGSQITPAVSYSGILLIPTLVSTFSSPHYELQAHSREICPQYSMQTSDEYPLETPFGIPTFSPTDIPRLTPNVPSENLLSPSDFQPLPPLESTLRLLLGSLPTQLW